MVDQIFPDLFRIEIPLPRNPLKALNCYVIKSRGQTLIIDTGLNREECISAMLAGLKELEVRPEAASFYLTHCHADHSGMLSTIAGDARVYASGPDADVINAMGRDGSTWENEFSFALRHGFPEEYIPGVKKGHPGFHYSARGAINFVIVHDGDPLTVGDYSFICVHTPGHTRGHTCLYEPKKKLLIAGDHILVDITPNISSYLYEEDPLNDYLHSLDKVARLDVARVLPGHRVSFTDLKGRIQELKTHHETRANEVVTILGCGPQCAYDVASQMTWDMDFDCWNQFPIAQKWFATGEAIAHLRYLEESGRVRAEKVGSKVIFSRPGK